MSNLSENQLKSIPIPATSNHENSSRNAIKHGACAVNTLILDCESHDDFLALETQVFQSFHLDPDNPAANPGEIELIREAVRANWIYRRAERNYVETEFKMLNEVPNTLMWGEDHHETLARFLRYRSANFNLLAKARKAVDDYRKARSREAAENAKLNSDVQKQTIAQKKFELHRDKNKPFDYEEELERMRQKGMRLRSNLPESTPPAR